MKPSGCRLFLTILLIWPFAIFLQVAAKTDTCEVCVAVLQKGLDALETADDRRDQKKIDAKLRHLCEGLKGKEHKFCFYIGALKDSATSIMGDVTKPLSWSMPPEKVCEKLRGMDAQICELKYDKAIDWKTVDLNKMRVKDLKKILEEWGEQCRACTEKSEFVNRIKELKPRYVKEEL